MHIILGSDGAIEADIASAIVKRLPLPGDVKLTVAMATAPAAATSVAFAPEQASIAYHAASESWRIQKQIAEQTVANISERLNQVGLSASPRVLSGDPGNELMALAKNLHAEMIAIGSGSNNRVTALLLGSVARKLVLYADTSILIGRTMEEKEGEEGTYSRLRKKEKLDILIAYDGSAGSELAIQSLSFLSRAAFGKVYILVVDERSPDLYALEALEDDQCPGCEQRKLASRALERIEACGDSVEIVVAAGSPSNAIAEEARKRDVDLIMIGANRHGIMERLIVGSCAYETMLSAPCSVLVIRHPLPFA